MSRQDSRSETHSFSSLDDMSLFFQSHCLTPGTVVFFHGRVEVVEDGSMKGGTVTAVETRRSS